MIAVVERVEAKYIHASCEDFAIEMGILAGTSVYHAKYYLSRMMRRQNNLENYRRILRLVI